MSTLAALFAEGQKVYELDDDDLGELADLVLEEMARRKGVDLALVVEEAHLRYKAAYKTAYEAGRVQ